MANSIAGTFLPDDEEKLKEMIIKAQDEGKELHFTLTFISKPNEPIKYKIIVDEEKRQYAMLQAGVKLRGTTGA